MTAKTVKEILSKVFDWIQNAFRVVITNVEVLLPVDIQSHWGEAVTLSASGARTVSGSGSEVNVERFITAEMCIDVTAVSGTFAAGEGLRVYIEGKDEITGKWKVLYDSYESLGGMITAPVTDWCRIDKLAFRVLRARWEISGTTPSFTFSVTGQMKA